MKKNNRKILKEYQIDYPVNGKNIKIKCQEKYTRYIKIKYDKNDELLLIIPYKYDALKIIKKYESKIIEMFNKREEKDNDTFYVFGQVYNKNDYSKKEIEEMYRKAIGEIKIMFYEIQKKYNFKKVELYFRKMRSRWGVCYPKQLKIGLSSYLSFVPRELVEYVIIHEFCHLTYANHSKDFYQLLATYLPKHREYKKQMKYYSKLL